MDDNHRDDVLFLAAWAQEKAESLAIPDLKPSHIEKLSGDNTRDEKERVMSALMKGYYIRDDSSFHFFFPS